MDLQDKLKDQLEKTFGGKFHKVGKSADSDKSSSEEKNNSDSKDKQAKAEKNKNNKDCKTVGFIRKSLGNFTTDHESLIGVDIAPHYIRVCQMKHAYDRWSLKSLASACIEGKYTTQDVMNEESLYVENLVEILRKNNIKTKDVALSIPESSSIIKVISVPEMEKEEFDQACALGAIWESQISIPGHISEYCVFYQILRRHSLGEKTGQPTIKMEEEAVFEETVFEEGIVEEGVEGVIGEGIEVPLDGVESAEGSGAEVMMEAAPADEVISEEVSGEEVLATEEIAAEGLDQEAVVVEEVVAEISTSEEVSEETEGESSAEGFPMEQAAVEGSVPDQQEIPEVTEEVSEDILLESMPEQQEGEVVEITEEVAELVEEEVAVEEPVNENLMDVLFVAARISDIELYSNIVVKAGLNPRVIDVRCLALKHAYDTDPEARKKKDLPVAFIEFGCDDNYIMVSHNDDVYTYDITISDEDRYLMIGETEEEDRFRNFVAKFAEQVEKKLTIHEEAYETPKIRDIYITTSTPLHVNDASSLPMIAIFVEEMKQRLENRDVSTCDFCNHIKVPEKFAKQINAEGNLSAWAVTLGLATEKFDVFDNNSVEHPGVDNVNLLPNVNQVKGREKNRVLAALGMFAMFVVIVLGMSTAYAMLSSLSNSLTNQIDVLKAAKVEKEHKDKKAEVARLSLMVKKMSSLSDVRSSLPSNQSQLLIAYKHINKSIPDGVWLTNVDFENPLGVKIEGKSIGDQNIIEFVKALDNKKVFTGISIKNMEAEKELANAKQTDFRRSPIKEFVLEGVLLENSAMQKLQLLSGEMSDGS